MKEKLNRFVDNTIGNFQEVSYRQAEYQCMDLAYEWIFVLDFPKAAIQHQYAYEVFTLASDITRQYFDIIPKTKDNFPIEGDLVVFKGGDAGHIAIAIEGNPTAMKIYEQNNPLGTNPNIRDRGYTNCLGFLRPKFTQPQGIPSYMMTLFQEANINPDDESTFREIWQKSIKYDDDVKSLQEQVRSANEALADKAYEVSECTLKNQKLSDTVAEIEELLNKLRADKDNLTTEKVRLEAQVSDLSSKVTELQTQNEALKGSKPLLGYSWAERFRSLFLVH